MTGLFEIVEMKMERSVAIKKLSRLLGKKLGYRVDIKAPSKEGREAARAELEATKAEFEKLKERREARYQAILAADQEYQSLKAACTAERERRQELQSLSSHYRITVGTSESIFFHVHAQGDSWEEVIDKLTAKEKQAA